MARYEVPRHLQEGYREAEKITKDHATIFYLASKLLDKEKRYSAYAVYALCRLSDESVDNPGGSCAKDSLDAIEKKIAQAFGDAEQETPLLYAFRHSVEKYRIPQEYFQEMTAGMRMDLEKNRYRDFKELHEYCYRSAGVVGLIMLKIFGYKNRKAEGYALNLGIAMQLTNILRDIKEDFARQRIYLPQDEMSKFQINQNDISEGSVSDDFKKFMGFQIQRARQYYRDCLSGIGMINDLRCRLVTLAMKELYEGILMKIEKNGYDVFSKRLRLNKAEKIMTLIKVLLRRKYL
ncbi:MAG: phytoene/squalene synthase family protein [Candidatus Omnitrophica bacterium]|nr:phytoene/squalene synthase family protein [Candidatus Omnitrophota bacterium]